MHRGFPVLVQGLFLGLGICYVGEFICKNLTRCVLMICVLFCYVCYGSGFGLFFLNKVAIEGKGELILIVLFFFFSFLFNNLTA